MTQPQQPWRPDTPPVGPAFLPPAQPRPTPMPGWQQRTQPAWTPTPTPPGWGTPSQVTAPRGAYYRPQPAPRKQGLAAPVTVVVTLLLAVALVFQVLGGIGNKTMREISGPRPVPQAPVLNDPVPSHEAEVTAALSTGVVLVNGETATGTSAGSGIILTESGLVLTNYHVVADTTELVVETADGGARYGATLLGRNAWQDVAVLQLAGASGLPIAPLGDGPVAVGDQVTAVGNANGRGRLVASTGGVTQLDAAIRLPSVFGGYGVDLLEGLIEFSAGAVPGYSGGPTFDAADRVIGVTSAGSDEVSHAMVTYSIPIGTAMQIADDIINERQSDQTRVGPGPWLGITIGGDNVPVATSILDDSPAARAGLTTGSTITSFRGVQISTASDLLKLLESSDPGETLELAWTDEAGTPREGFVTLGTSPTN